MASPFLGKSCARITVEVDVNGIDLPGLHAFVEYLNEGLPGDLHQTVNATPGVGAAVTEVVWRPERSEDPR